MTLRKLNAEDVDTRNPLSIAAWSLSRARAHARYSVHPGAGRAHLMTASLILHGKILANLDPVRLEARLSEVCTPAEAPV